MQEEEKQQAEEPPKIAQDNLASQQQPEPDTQITLPSSSTTVENEEIPTKPASPTFTPTSPSAEPGSQPQQQQQPTVDTTAVTDAVEAAKPAADDFGSLSSDESFKSAVVELSQQPSEAVGSSRTPEQHPEQQQHATKESEEKEQEEEKEPPRPSKRSYAEAEDEEQTSKRLRLDIPVEVNESESMILGGGFYYKVGTDCSKTYTISLDKEQLSSEQDLSNAEEAAEPREDLISGTVNREIISLLSNSN